MNNLHAVIQLLVFLFAVGLNCSALLGVNDLKFMRAARYIRANPMRFVTAVVVTWVATELVVGVLFLLSKTAH
jgi:hypothetical protein